LRLYGNALFEVLVVEFNLFFLLDNSLLLGYLTSFLLFNLFLRQFNCLLLSNFLH